MNQKLLNALLVLLFMSSTLVMIDNENNERDVQRQAAFASVDRLINDESITVEQAEACAEVIYGAVESRAIVDYKELGLGSSCTVGELVKHVEWGCQMECTTGH